MNKQKNKMAATKQITFNRRVPQQIKEEEHWKDFMEMC